MASSLTAVRLPIAQAALRFAPTPPRRARPGDRPRTVHRPSDRGGPAPLLGWPVRGSDRRRTATRPAREDRDHRHRTRMPLRAPESFGWSSRSQTIRQSPSPASASFATASHRRGPDTRAVFAVDKIAKVRELGLLPTERRREPTVRSKLRHYRASLEMLHRAAGELGLVDLLDAELKRAGARTVTNRSRSLQSRCRGGGRVVW
jgi:hypothetical protein